MHMIIIRILIIYNILAVLTKIKIQVLRTPLKIYGNYNKSIAIQLSYKRKPIGPLTHCAVAQWPSPGL